jgi:hypothetical protein
VSSPDQNEVLVHDSYGREATVTVIHLGPEDHTVGDTAPTGIGAAQSEVNTAKARPGHAAAVQDQVSRADYAVGLRDRDPWQASGIRADDLGRHALREPAGADDTLTVRASRVQPDDATPDGGTVHPRAVHDAGQDTATASAHGTDLSPLSGMFRGTNGGPDPGDAASGSPGRQAAEASTGYAPGGDMPSDTSQATTRDSPRTDTADSDTHPSSLRSDDPDTDVLSGLRDPDLPSPTDKTEAERSGRRGAGTAIVEWKRGNLSYDLVEVSHEQASKIIRYFREKWGSFGQPVDS